MLNKVKDDELVMSLVDRALTHPVDQREAYLRGACGVDTELFEQTWSYVQWEERMNGFLLEPALSGPFLRASLPTWRAAGWPVPHCARNRSRGYGRRI